MGAVRSAVGRRRPAQGWWSCASAALAVCLFGASAPRAQEVTEPALKAAFVYNVAKFVEWPPAALPPAAQLTICVLNDRQFIEELTRAVKDRALLGHGITVLRVEPDGPFRSCHVLYVSGTPPARVAAIAQALADAPVLTIGDLDDFVKNGGIARLFFQNGRLRLDVNLGGARRSQLRINSRLLALAAHVFDGPLGREP